MTQRDLSPAAMRSRDVLATLMTLSTFHRTRYGDNNFISRGEFYLFNLDIFNV